MTYFAPRAALVCWLMALFGGLLPGGIASGADEAGLELSPSSLPSTCAGERVEQSFFATGGEFPYTWVSLQNLPPGLSLSPSGFLSGSVAIPGDYDIQLLAEDAAGRRREIAFLFQVTKDEPLSVGNLLFIDRNHNGRADEGEGQPNVVVQLFLEGMDPLSARPVVPPVTTNAAGRYLFTGLGPARYFVHVPASQFQAGGPLFQHESAPGVGSDDGLDDDRDENGVDAAQPTLTGISSTAFALAANTEPTNATSESGTGTDDDLGMDNDGDMTIDLGFVRTCPALELAQIDEALAATQGLPFELKLSAKGGSSPYRFAAVDSLPPGLALTVDGVLSGIPVIPGTLPIHLRVTDAQQCAATAILPFTTKRAPVGTTIGNLVFIDGNANGIADSGEGVPDVRVNLKTAYGVPVASTSTGASGEYAFVDVPPGSYFVEVPPAMFASSGPLDGMKSLPGVMQAGDDDISEDGIDAPEPRATGVRTGNFTLVTGKAPTQATGERGFASASDDARDPFTDLTIDLGFTNSLPPTFAQWQVENRLNGQNGPHDNPDSDRYSNLMEYALGQNGASGIEDAQFRGFFIERADSGVLDAVLHRRAGGALDLRYIAESLTSDGWTELPAAVTQALPSGLEEVRFTGIENQADSGSVRLRVVLDADRDGVAEAEAITPAWFWKQQLWEQRMQTFSMPLVKKDVFTGIVRAVVTGGSLELQTDATAGSFAPYFTDGGSYYVEVIGGNHEGQRWDIDEAQSTAKMLRMDLGNLRNTHPTLPVTLKGDLISIRAHWTFAELFPVSQFNASTSNSTADRIVTMDPTTGSMQEFWLSLNTGTRRWVLGSDLRMIDQGKRVVNPAEGLFVHARHGPLKLTQFGIIRTNALACPLRAGMNLVGSVATQTCSPADWHMIPANGFASFADEARADRFHLWRGDLEAADDYASYTYSFFENQPLWDLMGDADLLDESTTPLFDPFRAVIVISRAGNPAWTLPAPAGK